MHLGEALGESPYKLLVRPSGVSSLRSSFTATHAHALSYAGDVTGLCMCRDSRVSLSPFLTLVYLVASV